MTLIRTILQKVGLSCGVAVCAYGVAMLLPKTYTSSMTLFFPANQAKPMGGIQALTGAAAPESDGTSVSNMGGMFVSPLVGSGPQTATGILTSRTCMLDVTKRLGLADHWRLSELKAADKLDGATSVHTEKSGFLIIDCNLDSAELSQKAVQAMYDHLNRRSSELTINVSKSNRIQVQQRFDEAVKEVKAKQQKLSDAMAGLPVSDAKEFDKVLLQARTQLDQAKVSQGSYRKQLAVLKAALGKVLNPKAKYPANVAALGSTGSAAASATATQTLNQLQNEIEQRQIELEDAGRKFAKGSPEYAAIKRKLDAAEAVAAKVISGRRQQADDGTRPDVLAVETQIEALGATIEGYEKVLNDYRGIAGQLPKQTSSLAAIQAEFNAALRKRESLDVELSRAKLAEERDQSRFEVVDPAILQPDPVAPRKGVIAVIFFLLALGVQFAPMVLKDPNSATAS